MPRRAMLIILYAFAADASSCDYAAAALIADTPFIRHAMVTPLPMLTPLDAVTVV